MIGLRDFPGHVQLMLLALRWRLSDADRLECQAVTAAGLDWEEFLALVLHHRVASLVFEVLHRLEQDRPLSVPAEILWQLRQEATLNAFRAVLSAGQTGRILRHFSSAGIELTVLKGLGLSQQVYASPSVRHVGDIDLLSPPGQLPQQIELLAELGYRVTIPDARLTPRRIASFTRYWKDCTLVDDAGDFPVELHWRLFNNRFHPGNRILDQASFTPMDLLGVSMRVLAPRDQFLHQAAHGVADAWIYLKTLADVAGYLRKFSPGEMAAALERAASIGLLAQVSAAVHLSNDWMGTDVTHPLLLAPAHPLGVAVRSCTEQRLLARNFRPGRDDPSPADWTRLERSLLPGLEPQLEIARRILNRPRVWSVIDLPDWLFWLYPALGAVLPPRAHTPPPEVQATRA